MSSRAGAPGPELLATILEAKFGQHLPLNRQSETFAREGIKIDVSTLADWVGACATALSPLVVAGPRPCFGGRAHSRRRHHGAGPGQNKHDDRPIMDLRA